MVSVSCAQILLFISEALDNTFQCKYQLDVKIITRSMQKPMALNKWSPPVESLA